MTLSSSLKTGAWCVVAARQIGAAPPPRRGSGPRVAPPRQSRSEDRLVRAGRPIPRLIPFAPTLGGVLDVPGTMAADSTRAVSARRPTDPKRRTSRPRPYAKRPATADALGSRPRAQQGGPARKDQRYPALPRRARPEGPGRRHIHQAAEHRLVFSMLRYRPPAMRTTIPQTAHGLATQSACTASRSAGSGPTWPTIPHACCIVRLPRDCSLHRPFAHDRTHPSPGRMIEPHTLMTFQWSGRSSQQGGGRGGWGLHSQTS